MHRIKANFAASNQQSCRWALLLLFASAVAGLCAQTEPSYRVDQWKTEHGLPQNSVQALHQSRDGYLWAGTLFGLARYDGFRFTVFDQANTPAMAATTDDCTCIAQELFEETLWVGTSKGLLRHAQGKFEHFKQQDGLIHRSVLALAPSKRGGIWIGTHGGLTRYANGKFEVLAHGHPPGRGLAGNIHCLLEDPETNLWAGTDSGVVEIRASGEVTQHNMPDRDVLALHRDRHGTVWIGYKHTGAVYALSNGVRHAFPLPTRRPGFPPFRSVASIFEDSSGRLWVNVSGDELLFLRDGELVRFESIQSAGISTRRGIEDAEGNLWFGTGQEGLLRLQPRRLMTYAVGNGSGYDKVWSVAESTNGTIWLGTDDGVLRLRNGSSEPIAFAGADQRASVVHSVFVDANDEVWAGRATTGVWKFDGTNFVRQFTKKGAPGVWDVSAIFQQRDGKLWFGSSQGLWLWSTNTLKRFAPGNGLPHSDVRGLLEDSHTNLWIATYSGLACLSNGVFSSYTTKDGLSHNQVYFLHEDKDGALWIGTQLGLTRLKNGRFFVFTTHHGLFDNVVNQLFEDRRGSFWIGCNRGIYRVEREDLEAVAAGKTNRVTCVVYGEADGMLSSETNGEHQPAGCRVRDGRMWFPTMKGAVVIDPERVHQNQRPPAVIIEEVTADEETLISNRPINRQEQPHIPEVQSIRPVRRTGSRGAISLAAGRARLLQIRYTATSLVDPDKVRFRYQLEGHDSKWQEAVGRRVALYTNLRPGRYTFRVKACNNHGFWNETGASFAFTLAPHFYQTWTFYVFSALAIGMAAYGAHRWRLHLAQRIQELKASIGLAEERARIAKDMHDDIGANLTRIGLLNEVARNSLEDPQRARTELNKVAVIAGETIGSLSELVWATNSNYDTLENTIVYLREYVARFFEPTDIRVVLKFPSDVPPLRLNFTFRRHLLLIVKEALNNIIKHAKTAQALVEVEVRGQQVYLCIRDHGLGINSQPCRGSATGLKSIQHRVAALNGTLKIDSKPNAGTCIEIMLPLEDSSLNAAITL